MEYRLCPVDHYQQSFNRLGEQYQILEKEGR